MFNKITRYTPEMFIQDRQGAINERQRAYAAKVAKMKGATLMQDGNALVFLVYGSKKTALSYSCTEYRFMPGTWATLHYPNTSNEYKITRYTYD